MFRVAPLLELKKLEAIFKHKIFRILLKRGKNTTEMIAMLSTWRHSGFHVFCGNRISPDDETALENLARYIIYPTPFSLSEGHSTFCDQYFLYTQDSSSYTRCTKKEHLIRYQSNCLELINRVFIIQSAFS